MVDLYDYIHNYNESYIDSLYAELTSKKYSSIRNCPSYHECEVLANILNVLSNSSSALTDFCNLYQTITPQSQIFERLDGDNDICSTTFRYIMENDYYQINVFFSDSKKNEILFDSIKFLSDRVKKHLSVDTTLYNFSYNFALDYLCKNSISIKTWSIEKI